MKFRKQQFSTVTKSLDRLFISNQTAIIFTASVLFAIIYLHLATPSKADAVSDMNMSIIIAIFLVTHFVFAWRIFPLSIVAFGRRGWNIVATATVTCLGANIAATAARLAFVPSNYSTLLEGLFLFLSIVITSTTLTAPGWIYYNIRSRDRIVMILQGAGIAVKNQDNPLTFNDKLQLKLPPAKRGRLLFLRAAGNYTEIVTTAGSHLLRIGLGEAIKSTSEPGLRVHKSFWVSRDEIVGLTHASGNPQITTQSGTVFPVSRSMVQVIRALL